MTGAGDLNIRVTFKSETRTADGQGGATITWPTVATVWGKYMPERGGEALKQGQLRASNLGLLTVRYQSALADLDAETSRVHINDEIFQIRSIINPDRRKTYLEMVVERGVAPHV